MKKYSEIVDDQSSDDDVIVDTLGEDTVCAVVFSREGALRAQTLLRDLPLKASRVREYQVQDRSSLHSTPRCAAYVMFIDYNQEDVILEHDTATQGILMLSSVQHLQTIKGSEMALVYIDDSGAVPASGELYSRHLRDQDHPIVADLAHRRRFLSVRYKWNTEQAESLKQWLPPNAMDRDKMAVQIDSKLHGNIMQRKARRGYFVAIVLLTTFIIGLIIFLIVYYQTS